MRFPVIVSMLAILAFSTPAAADEYVILRVNGTDVSSSEVERAWQGLFPVGQAPAFDSVTGDVKDRVLRAIMAEKILYNEALKQGVDKSPTLQREVEDLKKKLIVRTFLSNKTEGAITDADVKKAYDAQVAEAKDEKEVRARHILLANEKEAKEAKSKLDAGKSFEDVARELSKDAGSAKQGGDLGYFTRDKMVPEFASAAFSLKKGEVSGPVKSPFGFHIIKVADVRKKAVPSFAESKEAIRAALQEKKLNDYIGGLVKSADVKLFDATGKETTFNKNLPDAAKVEQPKPASKPVETKPEPKAEAKPEPKSASAKSEAKAKAETKPEAKPSTKAQKAAAEKESAKKESKSSEKAEAKPLAEEKAEASEEKSSATDEAAKSDKAN